MYKMTENQLVLPEDFFLPFGGNLNKENRWVVLANLIPWWQFEEAYANTMKRSSRGQQAFSVSMALGALYIQQRKGLSDRETVEEITENPYLQYFIGLPEFQEEPPFDASMMTHFRKRLDAAIINQLNEAIVMEELGNIRRMMIRVMIQMITMTHHRGGSSTKNADSQQIMISPPIKGSYFWTRLVRL